MTKKGGQRFSTPRFMPQVFNWTSPFNAKNNNQNKNENETKLKHWRVSFVLLMAYSVPNIASKNPLTEASITVAHLYIALKIEANTVIN